MVNVYSNPFYYLFVFCQKNDEFDFVYIKNRLLQDNCISKIKTICKTNDREFHQTIRNVENEH